MLIFRFISRVFQERLLVPRSLHFSYDQLFWECGQLHACERYPRGDSCLSDEVVKGVARSQIRQALFAHNQATARKPKDTVDILQKTTARYYDMWMYLISDYTRTRFTNPLDKLVALSGIVKPISVITDGAYLAGFWRTTLEQDLLWYNCNFLPDRNAARTYYVAPTWSWASIGDPVRLWKLSGCASETLFQVLDVVLQHSTEDATGCVTSGWLDL